MGGGGSYDACEACVSTTVLVGALFGLVSFGCVCGFDSCLVGWAAVAVTCECAAG